MSDQTDRPIDRATEAGNDVPAPRSAIVAPAGEGEFVCYLHPGWNPVVRSAPPTRAWMDATNEAFAYRCLPLNIANAHGWEALATTGFEATWTGGNRTEDIAIRADDPADPTAPVSIFGFGVLTFHMAGIMRTPPGWNLFVTGSPNLIRDGIQPLSGVIETDWSPYSFTMNYRFTRPCTVRFEPGEPYLFFFPVPRGALQGFAPRAESLADAPELMDQFKAWSRSRDAFRDEIARREATERLTGSQKWQKRYYRGVDMTDRTPVDDHEARLRVPGFAGLSDTVAGAPPPAPPAPARADAAEAGADADLGAALERLGEAVFDIAPRADLAARLVAAGLGADAAERALDLIEAHPLAALGRRLSAKLKRREWVLRAQMQNLRRGGRLDGVARRADLTPEAFAGDFLALGLPVVLAGLIADRPAVRHWTPATLAARLGGAEVEVQADRTSAVRYEWFKDAHRRVMPFDAFLAAATDPSRANEVYITAYNGAANSAVLAPLFADLAPIPDLLDPKAGADTGLLWIGGAGTFTSLHHDLTNNLLVQVVGRKVVTLAPPGEVARLANETYCFSDIGDLDAARADPARAAALDGLVTHEVVLAPGDGLFIPVGWWHQVRSLDFSVSATYTHFRTPNDFAAGFPAR